MHDFQIIPSWESRKLDSALRERLAGFLEGETLGVLATCGRDHEPLASLMAFAWTKDLDTIVLATPRESKKNRNILENPKVSFLVGLLTSVPSPDFSAMNLRFSGPAGILSKREDRIGLERLFVRRYPELQEFVAASGTDLIRLKVESMVLVENFQRVIQIAMEKS